MIHVGCVPKIPGLEDSGDMLSALSLSELLEVSLNL